MRKMIILPFLLLFTIGLGYDVTIQQPTQGAPAIVNFPPIIPDDYVTAFVNVSDGSFVATLDQADFTVTVGGLNAFVVSSTVNAGGQYYELVFSCPQGQPDEGLYDLTVMVDDLTDTGSGTELAAILYTGSYLMEQGLRWLSAQQAGNGAWDCPTYGGNNAGITALVLQAYLAAGYDLNSPIYGQIMLDATNYILSRQQAGGQIYTSTIGYENPMCIVALTSLQKTVINDPVLDADIQTAIDAALAYVLAGVQPYPTWDKVSWRYTNASQNSGDMSVNQWTYLALEATEYADNGIWQQVYNYLWGRQCYYGMYGDEAMRYQGYQSCGTRNRGNTLAAIWGAIIADQHGVAGASQLADEYYNFIVHYGYDVNGLISHPSLNSYCTVWQAGYYYYIYELSKAFALGGKSQVNGENWYSILYDRIDGQHQEDANGYYWTTQFTDPTGYWIEYGGIGTEGYTALALLSLQVGTVPPDSRFVIALEPDVAVGSRDGELPCLTMAVFDEFGNFAGVNEEGEWVNEIPGAEWIYNDETQQLDLELTQATNYAIIVCNSCEEGSDYTLSLFAYLGDNPDPVSEEVFEGYVDGYECFGVTANVNAIGGLTIYATEPAELPNMELTESAIYFPNLVPTEVHEFTFDIMETAGDSAIFDVDVYATDLVDGFGNVIPGESIAFSLDRLTIEEIPAGTSVTINGSFTVPDEVSYSDQYTGLIVVESSNAGSKNIDVFAGAEWQPLIGDLNADGIVDILDVIVIVEISLGYYDATPYHLLVGDLNPDGTLNIVDLVALVSMILNQNLAMTDAVQSAELMIENQVVSINADGTVAGIELNVSGEYEIVNNLNPGWTIENTAEKILLFTADGSPLIDSQLFQYEGTLSVSSALVVDWNFNSVEADLVSVPNRLTFAAAYPNPFNPVTSVDYGLPEEMHVSIEIYDMLGRSVAQLVDGRQAAGAYRVSWDASNQSSGAYIVKMIAGNEVMTQKIMYVK